jgi:hypothetical protein
MARSEATAESGRLALSKAEAAASLGVGVDFCLHGRFWTRVGSGRPLLLFAHCDSEATLGNRARSSCIAVASAGFD